MFLFRYNGDERFTTDVVDLWMLRISQKASSILPHVKQFNKEAGTRTAARTRQKEMDDSQTNYNPGLLSKCMAEVAKSGLVKQLLVDLNEAESVDELEEKAGEVIYRSMLQSTLLVLANGQRGDTIASMTVGELRDAKTEEGIKVVKVAQHKTKGTYGSANLSFALPGLWKATRNYVELYR